MGSRKGHAGLVWRPGCAWKDGKLYVFEPRRLLVARSWPDLAAWYKTPARPWRHTRRWADRLIGHFLFPAGGAPASDQRSDGYLERLSARRLADRGPYFDAIPAAIRAEALRYRNRRWHLLCLFARCPGALELSASNPALAFALASNWVFHRPAVQRPLRAVRSLLRKRQREILGWLGFPATESVRRVLGKIEAGAVSVERLLYLRDALSDPAVLKALSHLPSISAPVLEVVNRPRLRALASPSLLAELSAMPDPVEGCGEGLPAVVMDFLRLLRLLGESGRAAPFASIVQLRRAHEELVQSAAEEEERAAVHRQIWALPEFAASPPFPGTATVVPLVTARDLFEEGAAMRHCVAARAVEVAEGREFVYRVTSPVRATLSVRKVGGRWEPHEMRGPYNGGIAPLDRACAIAELDLSAAAAAGFEGEDCPF